MKKNWQTIIKAIIAVLSALLGALGTSAMYNGWWTPTKEEGSPQRTSLFYCFDFNITNTLWQYRSRRLAISLVSIGNIARVDWQYRLRRLAISIVLFSSGRCFVVFLQFAIDHSIERNGSTESHNDSDMTSLSLMSIGLPASHPFWSDAEAPLTQEKAGNGKPFPKDHLWKDDIVTKDKF